MQIRDADVSEHDELNALYVSWGYAGGIAADDRVLVAMLDRRTVGLVRECHECDSLLLRGLWVDPNHQRRGVGQELLAAFVTRTQNADCYCLPFAHLIPLYQRQRFEVVPDDALPHFLAERLADYRRDGREIVAMRRRG